jgi:hypothetical protein
MHTGTSFREPARVVMHLNGGFTKVALERTLGSGMADGGVYWDIPTGRIPLHLRHWEPLPGHHAIRSTRAE